MPCQLRFRASLSATCLSAAQCVWRGVPAADSTLENALGDAAQELIAAIQAARWPVDEILSEMLNLAAEYDNNAELAERAAARRLGMEASRAVSLSRIAGAVADLEQSLLSVEPDLVEQLAVRGRPLREQIEARAPGLVRQIARLCDEAVEPEFAEIVLVAPYAAGYGQAHPQSNRVTLEAVLVNPHAELPETVRGAWLLSQLNLDLPRFAEALPRGRHTPTVELGMIPPTLAASETVELATMNASSLALALHAWHVDVDDIDATVATLQTWWSTFSASSTTWRVALAALDHMLA